MSNPFFYGGKVSPDLFVGRSQQLRRIFSGLEIANTGQLQSISIVGPHRIGRSSLLNYVAARYKDYLQSPASYRFIYLSPHDANCHNAGEFLCKVLDCFDLPLHTHHNTTLQEFQESILPLKERDIHPVVCLDEFEELLDTNRFPDEFFDVLRYLMSESALAFVIASTLPLSDLVSANKYTSPFFNIFTLVPIGEFIVDQKVNEAELLIDRGIRSDRPFNDTEVQQMRRMAGRHPYKLQLAGSLIYQAKETETVHWKPIDKDFKAQLKQAGLIKSRSRVFFLSLKALVISIGSALLILRRSKDEINESDALLWGIGIILFVLLIILGVIPISYFLKFGVHWLG